MRRLREILARPIPAEQSLLVFAAAVAILLLAAAVLMAIPGPSTDTPDSDSVVVEVAPVEPRPTRELENTVETTVRRFMVGYLRLTSGLGDPARVESASPELIRRLGRSVRISPAARRRHLRLAEIDAGPVSLGRAKVTATVESAGVTFPVILDLELIGGRWLVTRVAAE